METLLFKSVQETMTYLNQNTQFNYVFYVPIDKISELSQKVGTNVVLCSTSGEYTCKGYENGVITGFRYESNLGNVIEILNPPILSMEPLQVAYDKVRRNNNAFMLLMCDGLSGMEECIISTFFFMDKNFKIIGGSAGDNLKFESTHIYVGSKKVHSVAIFFDLKGKTQLIKENLYEPFSEKLLITDADPINRVVKKINDKPAATEYARILGISENKLSDAFMNNPLGKMYKDEILIASPMKVNPDKSITFYCQVMPNTFVYMLKPVDHMQKLNETISKLSFKPNFMIVINCILRSLKFQNEHSWKSIDQTLLKVCENTTGFISYGEQFYNHHVNQTMVILAVEQERK